MQLFTWLHKRMTGQSATRSTPVRKPTSRFRPQLEALEDRMLPSTYSAATASQLIADINAANTAGGTNTIVLNAPTSTYVLTGVNNTTNGNNVLPVISGGGKKLAADNLTIVGNNYTIDASQVGRLFDVGSGASLTLENVTLQNGLAYGSGAAADGGAIYNQGTLDLVGVVIQNNAALGSPGGTASKKNEIIPPGSDAAGGGIWSNGSLTVQHDTLVQGNSATGGDGGYNYATQQYGHGGYAFGGGICIAGGTADIESSYIGLYDPLTGSGIGNSAQGGNGGSTSQTPIGGWAFGGGVYVAGGMVTMGNGTLVESNTVQGGDFSGSLNSGVSGYGYGAGMYVAGGTVTLTNTSVDHNLAGTFVETINSAYYANGYGGGIFIVSGATVNLDSFTVANTAYNTDQSGTNGPTANIDGLFNEL